jgi:hypothetical protein
MKVKLIESILLHFAEAELPFILIHQACPFPSGSNNKKGKEPLRFAFRGGIK